MVRFRNGLIKFKSIRKSKYFQKLLPIVALALRPALGLLLFAKAFFGFPTDTH